MKHNNNGKYYKYSTNSANNKVSPREVDDNYFKPLQIIIHNNAGVDRAIKNFRSLVQAEGTLALYKEKSRYEKPSDKKRRKDAESLQRVFEEEMKQKKILSGEYEKEKEKKLLKKEQKNKLRNAEKTKELE